MDPWFWNQNPLNDSIFPPRRGRGNSFEKPVNSTSERPKKPKSVVDIPVEFVDSSEPKNSKMKSKKKKNSWRQPQMSRPMAALKIQKAFRGFSVRKTQPLNNLRTIANSKATVEKIRQQINNREFVELIRQNAKERLKITEEIMMAMLKLDAIQGVNAVVRESRRAVIRELVKLQETVDDILMEKCRNEIPEQERKVREEKEFVTPDYSQDSFQPSKELDEPLQKCCDDLSKNSTSKTKVPEDRDFVSANENKNFPELGKEFSNGISLVEETEICKVSSELPHTDNNKDRTEIDSNENLENDLRSAKGDNGADTEVGIAKPENNDFNGENRSIMENLMEENNNLREKNNNLKKAIEDLCSKNQMQDDIIAKITKKLEELEKKMLECENEEEACEEWTRWTRVEELERKMLDSENEEVVSEEECTHVSK